MGTKQPDISVGRLLEYTEEDRVELMALAETLHDQLQLGRSGIAATTLAIFKITQRAIRRSHAT